jgi:hypothetical protein
MSPVPPGEIGTTFLTPTGLKQKKQTHEKPY